MTYNQDRFYWREWGKVSKALQKQLNKPLKDVQAMRHQLHKRALGYEKSHKNFTNQEFDKVLACFRAQYAPSDINYQIKQNTQASRRTKYVLQKTIDKMGLSYNYVNGMAQNMFKIDLDQTDASQQSRIIAALEFKQKRHRKNAAMLSDNEPF